jgi:hypothetical protein
MNKMFLLGIAAMLLSLPVGASAASAPPNAAQMQKIEYLVGTWTCEVKAGGQVGSAHEKFESAFRGAWLLETESVPSSTGSFVDIAKHYTGYDTAKKQYVHLGPNLDGSYEVATSADAAVWHSGANAIAFTKVSNDRYTMSADTMDGKPFSFLKTCNRTS